MTQYPTAVHVVNRMAPGGIETLVLDLKRSSTSRVVICSLEGSRDELIEAWPVLKEFSEDLFGFGVDRKSRNFSVVPDLWRAMRNVGATQVFAHHIGPLLYGGLAARAARVSSFVHIEHDAWHYDENPRHVQILKSCEWVLRPQHYAVSRPIGDRMRELLGARARISVVPPGIDTERYRIGDQQAARLRLGLEPGGYLVGTAGRLSPVKGHDVLIAAMMEMDADVRLVVIGEGDERVRLEQQISRLGLDGRVTLLGHRDDMVDIYPALDLFCLPSHNEGLPRVVLEAQACGIPVVASDVGAMRDAVSASIGRLVEPNKPDALAAALKDVLLKAYDRAQVREHVCVNFDFSRTRQHYAATPSAGARKGVASENVSALCS